MKYIYLIVLTFILLGNTSAQEVKITGNKFTLNNSEIWFNGINTPWHLFGDFGRHDFVPEWWTNEFAKYKANNINLARVWVHMSGEFSPNIEATGFVSGTNDIFWDHMDHLMDVAEANEVYLMPALFSFDITKNGYKTTAEWRKWIQSEENIQSYIDNVLIPMLTRYESRKYILAWEICNEPEWMFENSEHGPQSFDDVQRMHAMLAAAVHENSSKLVTTGSAAPKWNAPIYDSWGDNEGNMFSDEALSASINNTNAFLDFYQFHWYPWQSEWMKSPFTMTTEAYGVDNKPVIVGESEGNNVCDKYICQTVTEMYESAYANGFDGVCAWKTPQNDGHGTFENIAEATNSFYNNHPNLIYPGGTDPVAATGITISEGSLELEEGKTAKLVAKLVPSNASDKRITWASSEPSIVSVSNGTVTALVEGVSKISATSNDGNFSATCVITVTKREPACSSPSELETLPHIFNGAGEFCWSTSGNVSNINSWNADIIEVNGVDITNKYTGTMPEKVNGQYYIYFKASHAWSHIEINGAQTKSATGDTNIDQNIDCKIYPNPASNYINIEGYNDVVSLTLISPSGLKLIEKAVNSSSAITLPVSKYPAGIYILQLKSDTGTSQSHTIVIK